MLRGFFTGIFSKGKDIFTDHPVFAKIVQRCQKYCKENAKVDMI